MLRNSDGYQQGDGALGFWSAFNEAFPETGARDALASRERNAPRLVGVGVTQVVMECGHLVDRQADVGGQAHRKLQTQQSARAVYASTASHATDATSLGERDQQAAGHTATGLDDCSPYGRFAGTG
ncbi:hypothetical protein ACFYP6_37615 [Streptomyces goshikiensis]|uniref:hypothetical protein n=1 Tax=Streptomyces goshikiensis TaxID=1942 RepID=UPI00368535B4